MPGKISVFIAVCLAALLAGTPGRCEPDEDRERPGDADELEPEKEQPEEETPPDADEDLKDKEKEEAEKELTPLEKAFQKAEKNLEAGRISRAYSAFARLAKRDDEAIAARAAEKLEKIEADGRQEVKKALALDDPKEATKKLNEIYRDYWRTPVKDALVEARKMVRLKKAKKTVAGANEDVDPDEEADPDEEDEEKSAEEEDKAARSWLIVGDIHLLNGRAEEAKRAFLELIYEYPQNRFAEEARDRLERLQIDETAEAPGDEE